MFEALLDDLHAGRIAPSAAAAVALIAGYGRGHVSRVRAQRTDAGVSPSVAKALPERLWSLAEVAAEAGMKPATVRDHARRAEGQLQGWKQAGNWVFLDDAVRRFLRKRKDHDD
jgi:hypothetical protein